MLNPIAIPCCFLRLLHDGTFISVAGLQLLGPMDMVVAGWLCEGHLYARASQCLKDPWSTILWDLFRLMQQCFVHRLFHPRYIFEIVFLLRHSR